MKVVRVDLWFLIFKIIKLPIRFILIRIEGTDNGYCLQSAVAILPNRIMIFIKIRKGNETIFLLLEIVILYTVWFFTRLRIFFIFPGYIKLLRDHVPFLPRSRFFRAAQGTCPVFIMLFASFCWYFCQEITLVGRDTLGCHSRTRGINQTLHRLIAILFLAAVYRCAGQNHAVQPVPMMGGIGFLFRFIGNRSFGYSTLHLAALNGNWCQGLFPIISAVMENDLPPDGIRNLTEVNVIRVCIGNLVVVGIFLQHDHSVFVKIGAEPRFVTEKVLAGDAVYGLIPIF